MNLNNSKYLNNKQSFKEDIQNISFSSKKSMLERLRFYLGEPVLLINYQSFKASRNEDLVSVQKVNGKQELVIKEMLHSLDLDDISDPHRTGYVVFNNKIFNAKIMLLTNLDNTKDIEASYNDVTDLCDWLLQNFNQ
jgi:hypothetical protein